VGRLCVRLISHALPSCALPCLRYHSGRAEASPLPRATLARAGRGRAVLLRLTRRCQWKLRSVPSGRARRLSLRRHLLRQPFPGTCDRTPRNRCKERAESPVKRRGTPSFYTWRTLSRRGHAGRRSRKRLHHGSGSPPRCCSGEPRLRREVHAETRCGGSRRSRRTRRESGVLERSLGRFARRSQPSARALRSHFRRSTTTMTTMMTTTTTLPLRSAVCSWRRSME
jgi:hypothetical protein